MKFTLSWLKDHLDTTASLADISKTLTAIGLEVEQITDRAAALSAFTVAKILQAEKHPEADKLRVCKVLSDVGELQIVCGAPNARAGIFVALAKEGALIPRDGFVIKKTKIRGVESNGMLCSADELKLGGDSEGIIELPKAPIGAPIAEVLGLNDPVIEIAITPNRADCLGVRGIARDLAAAGVGNLKPSPSGRGLGEGNPHSTGTSGSTHPNLLPGGEGIFPSPISVSITSPYCQQFIGIYLRGVSNTPSPAWLKQRLEAIGQKSISALVDITNYLTFDLGRPLHAYDAKKLQGSLTVRPAQAGEPFAALNGKNYELAEGMCVIADQAGVQALGGIIGGAASAVGESTTDIFLEVALFTPSHVAQNGRALQIDSDARYRFERGVDVAFVQEGAERAVALIQSLCGGEASTPVIAGDTPQWKRTIPFNPARVASLGGVNVPATRCEEILTSLGFSGDWRLATDDYTIHPPSWRADVEGEADLVEEILRIHGYDNLAAIPLPRPAGMAKTTATPAQKRVHQARTLLVSRGYLECCSFSFISQAQAAAFGGVKPSLLLANPISADLDTMRPSLLPGLLHAAQKNINRGQRDVMIAEIGLQFSDIGEKGQQMVACGLQSGARLHYVHGEQFQEQRPAYAAYDAKADAVALLATLGVAKYDITTDTPPWYHPGRSGALTLGGKIILGYFGELHPAVLSQFGIEQATVAFEIFLEAIPLPRAKSKARPALKLSDFPAVERDFAFLVASEVSAAEIEKTLRSAEKTLLSDVSVFDVYSGKGVPEGKKSVAVRIALQSFERTLTEDDIQKVSSAMVIAAAKFGGTLRQ